MLGRTEQAVARINESIALAQKLQHPFSKSIALSFGALLHQLRRDAASTCRLAKETISLCIEHGIETFLEMGNVMLGWAQNEESPDSGGVELIQKGIAAWRATGADLVVPHFQQILAAALLENGKYSEALTAIEGDLIYRCGLGSETRDEAENCLIKAVEISSRQRALSLKLRAQVSLGQLLMERGEAEDAQRSLAETYAQFQEDPDSEDLRQAKTALDRFRSVTS
jgi:tetratricopeptide (TPR) repeat protein